MTVGSNYKHLSVVIGLVLLLCIGTSLQGQQPKADASTKASPPPSYVGSDVCKGCHKNVFDSWANNPHAAVLASEGLTDNMKGCESCHGPGSAHAADPSAVKPVNPEKLAPIDSDAVCGKCHYDDQPGAVNGKTLKHRYWQKSEHNREGISCLACHSTHQQSPELLKKQLPELCAGCHSDIVKKGDYLHAPVAGGACLKCHDPHGSNAHHQLVPDVSKVCLSCHSSNVAAFTKAHKGYDVSSSHCESCHSAHSRDKAGKLLKADRHMPFKSGQCQTCHKSDSLDLIKPEKELCTSCHSSDMTQEPTDGTIVHAPVSEGMCTQCHSPHDSDAPKGLFRDRTVAYSCFLCHSKVEASVDSKYPHKPARDLDCVKCHTPHSGKNKNLLVKDSINLCKDCHEPHAHPVGKSADGKTVIDPTTNEMLTCASCHAPHGSDFDMLTKKDKSADLCVTCHKLDH